MNIKMDRMWASVPLKNILWLETHANKVARACQPSQMVTFTSSQTSKKDLQAEGGIEHLHSGLYEAYQ